MTRTTVPALSYWDGESMVPGAELGYWDGVTVTPLPDPLLVIQRGYSSVDAMLTPSNIGQKRYFAHRGGSIEYPEMTLRAYTQAAIEGFGCLEFSAARTSDGVIVGCHDADIDRVVVGGGDYPPVSQMTWAQIQERMVKPPSEHPGRAAEPFSRIEQVVAAYGKTHLIMFDPKSISPTHYPQILAYMDANGGPSRWIGKWVGSNAQWSTALRSRGYKSWGAYYNSDDRTSVANSQGQWDILGFNYGAPAEDWSFILSFGKPVYAHVCPDQAAVDSAIAKGAAGAQVSGTEAVDVYKVF